MLSNWTCLLYIFSWHCHITVQEVFVCTWNNYNQLQGTSILQFCEKCVHIYMCVCVCACACAHARPVLYNQLFYPVMENVHAAVLVSSPLWGSWPPLGKMDENWSVALLPGRVCKGPREWACGGGWDRRARSSATNQLWRLNLCTTYNDSVWASQRTHCASMRKTSRWMFNTDRAVADAAFTCSTVWMSH
jgi:hypothetical protein